MASLNYSTLIVNDNAQAVGSIAEVASVLGESVAVVDSWESFHGVYSPAVRCIVLELSMPAFCGIEVLRHLSESRSRAALVLTTDMSEDLLDLAEKLATAFGLIVVDRLLAPFETERLQQAMIAATDPASVSRRQRQVSAPPTPDDCGAASVRGGC